MAVTLFQVQRGEVVTLSPVRAVMFSNVERAMYGRCRLWQSKIMKLKYVPKQLSHADTTVVIRELRAIEQEQGLIVPKAVVEKARSKESPLHKFFEWENKAAADAYRETQARRLIATVYIRHSDNETSQPVRAFVNIKATSDEDEEETQQGYVSIQNAMKSVPMQEQVMAYARQQLVLWRLKFGNYQQFFGVVQEIDKITKPQSEKAA